MALFYWVNQGRLGNLLFQYAAIKRHIAPNDRVYSFRHDLLDLMELDPRFRVIAGSGALTRRVSYKINSVARLGVRFKIVGSLTPQISMLLGAFPVESRRVDKTAGAIPGSYVVQGFFQDARLINMPICIRPELVRKAKSMLDRLAIDASRVAVHIRLTDYSGWDVLGKPGAVLPVKWYEDRMNEIRRRLGTPRFIVFSDDISAVEQLGLGDDVAYFRAGSRFEDFAAMALCDHAIISPSTFAWWSALTYTNSAKIVMAPEFWAGYKSSVWYPPSIQTRGIEYYPVAIV